MDIAALDNTDTIVHLAGAGIAEHRWTPQYRLQIIDSRTQSTALLIKTLRHSSQHRVSTFVGASAVGFTAIEEINCLLKLTLLKKTIFEPNHPTLGAVLSASLKGISYQNLCFPNRYCAFYQRRSIAQNGFADTSWCAGSLFWYRSTVLFLDTY